MWLLVRREAITIRGVGREDSGARDRVARGSMVDFVWRGVVEGRSRVGVMSGGCGMDGNAGDGGDGDGGGFPRGIVRGG